ncbi:Protein phosphatase methylesterase 1 [Gossypium arboreum]|uniref:Protein phosphatase methylesterase 1 n=1 Tax=Gossypium arboreum TaxID=29729 RepID=A0A0B0MR86_GOSAR|nr:Protein phosphatase methylesterase 1 [Gossypium arboreum]
MYSDLIVLVMLSWLDQLYETESFSRYEGLSEKFLSSPVPKLLLLAGTDRLDRALTIGQMQGKFQMVVVRHTGHAIQEDVPDEFATLIINFISRNRIGPHGVEIPGLARPKPAQAQGQSPAQTKS